MLTVTWGKRISSAGYLRPPTNGTARASINFITNIMRITMIASGPFLGSKFGMIPVSTRDTVGNGSPKHCKRIASAPVNIVGRRAKICNGFKPRLGAPRVVRTS